MAKAKSTVNKAALVREFLAANKKRMPAEISKLILAEKGIAIPASYISIVKSQMKGKRKARKFAKQVAGPSGDNGALYAAAKLVMTAGGVEQAQAALDAVKKVASIMV